MIVEDAMDVLPPPAAPGEVELATQAHLRSIPKRGAFAGDMFGLDDFALLPPPPSTAAAAAEGVVAAAANPATSSRSDPTRAPPLGRAPTMRLPCAASADVVGALAEVRRGAATGAGAAAAATASPPGTGGITQSRSDLHFVVQAPPPVRSSFSIADATPGSAADVGASTPLSMSDQAAPVPTTAAPSKAQTLTEADGVLVVQYELPIKLERVAGIGSSPAKWSASWNDEALLSPKGAGSVAHRGSSLAAVRAKWIGTVRAVVPPDEEEAVARVLEPFHCIPVFLPPDVARTFYEGYVCDTLWPIFNNVIDVYGELPTRWWIRERQADRWKSYMDVNKRFAATVVESFHESDLVWVHDLHLLLVPMLLARRHIAPVGLFLHAPFPSSEVFRTLSVRDEVLRGMLAADHIGFHLFEHARHFLTSCRRILGHTSSPRRGGLYSVDAAGREVVITVSHVGIEPEFLASRFRGEPALTTAALAWRDRFPGATLVGGIDSLERLKGVALKLTAFGAFLKAHPAWLGRVTLVQVCTTEEDVKRPGESFDVSSTEIQQIVDRVNAAYSLPDRPPPVALILRARVELDERLAFAAACDVFVNTAIRDGLNLIPFEYAYVRGSGECVPTGLDALTASGGIVSSKAAALAQLPPGVLILSEFSGCSRVLSGSLRVNPFRIEEVVSALAHALTMSVEEQTARAASSLAYVRGNTTASWAERVLLDLKAVSSKSTARTYMGYGLGLGYRLMGFGSSFRSLNTEHVVAAYRKAGHRLIVVDYGELSRLLCSTEHWCRHDY